MIGGLNPPNSDCSVLPAALTAAYLGEGFFDADERPVDRHNAVMALSQNSRFRNMGHWSESNHQLHRSY